MTIQTKKWLKDEAKSFFTTFITTLALEAVSPLMQLYAGDWSQATVTALYLATGRTLIKTLLTLIFPSLFPIRTAQVSSDAPQQDQ